MLNPYAGIPADGNPIRGRIVRIIVPASEVVSLIGVPVPPEDYERLQGIADKAIFAKTTAAMVTDAETGATLTMDNLAGRSTVRASHVGIIGDIAFARP